MNIVGRVSQTAAALWILNVWFNRFDKDTGYRGGDATNMREEFEEYGFSETTIYAVGAAKVSLAVLMLIGLVKPKVRVTKSMRPPPYVSPFEGYGAS